MSLTKKIVSLLIFIALAFGASAWGGLVTSFYKEPWYSQLVLSPLSPPAWVFGPVWTTLYVLMSIAVWRVWQESFNRKILFIYQDELQSLYWFHFGTFLIRKVGHVTVVTPMKQACRIKQDQSAMSEVT